jgi:hypothetical protein
MPCDSNTNVTPVATIASIETCRAILKKLLTVKNVDLARMEKTTMRATSITITPYFFYE